MIGCAPETRFETEGTDHSLKIYSDYSSNSESITCQKQPFELPHGRFRFNHQKCIKHEF